MVEMEVAHIPQVLEDHILSKDHNYQVDDRAPEAHSLQLAHLDLQDSHSPGILVLVWLVLEEVEVEHAWERREYEQIS